MAGVSSGPDPVPPGTQPPTRSKALQALATVALVLGCCLLLVGITAGAVNRNVLDEQRFSGHVESVRTDADVQRALGRAIAARVLELAPDLVAVRPLVESSAATVAGSPLLAPVVRTAAVQLHRGLTSGDGSLVLRLADVGALLTATLRLIAPEAAARLPDDFAVTLARVGSGSLTADWVR